MKRADPEPEDDADVPVTDVSFSTIDAGTVDDNGWHVSESRMFSLEVVDGDADDEVSRSSRALQRWHVQVVARFHYFVC